MWTLFFFLMGSDEEELLHTGKSPSLMSGRNQGNVPENRRDAFRPQGGCARDCARICRDMSLHTGL